MSPEMDLVNMLPDDALLHILGYLDDAHLCAARTVCQLWNALICEPYLWRKRFVQRWAFLPAGEDAPLSWLALYAARRGAELRMRGGRPVHYRVTTTRLPSAVLALTGAPDGGATHATATLEREGDVMAHAVPLADGVEVAAPWRVCSTGDQHALAPTGNARAAVCVADEADGGNVRVGGSDAVLRHMAPVLGMAWCEDGVHLATHTARVVSVWDTVRGRRVGVRVFDHVQHVRWCVHDASALLVASGTTEALVGVYEGTGDLAPRWEGQVGGVVRGAVLHGSGMCAVRTADLVHMVDLAARRLGAADVPLAHDAPVAWVDERTLVVVRAHVLVGVDAQSGAERELVAMTRADAEPLTIHALFADADRLVAGCSDHAVHVCVRGEEGGGEDAWQHRYVLLGGSRRRRHGRAPEHPTRRGCSFVRVDASRVVACFGSVVRVYTFT